MDVNTEEKEYVYGLLERYQEDTRKMEALRYELAHPKRVTSDEMIESMNFGQPATEDPPPKVTYPTKRSILPQITWIVPMFSMQRHPVRL